MQIDTFEKNVTFVIVCYKSKKIIEKCIKSINPKIKIIIVENSSDFNLKINLEKKFSNLKVIVSKSNLGYSKGNNLGISKVKSKYAFILNPDAYLAKNTLQELKKAIFILKDNFSILAPNSKENFDFFKIDNKEIKKDIFSVDRVKGFAMLLNLKNIKFRPIFDNNFFLFLEEIDLCKKIKNNNIFIAKNSKIFHLAKKSSENNLQIELCRNWHWMWSLFYYNLKNFGMLTAYKVTLRNFFLSIFKLFLYKIIFRKKKYLIYKYRLLGLINSYLGKDSWLRPHHIQV
jgi:GT2 family glycosyltransferase